MKHKIKLFVKGNIIANRIITRDSLNSFVVKANIEDCDISEAVIIDGDLRVREISYPGNVAATGNIIIEGYPYIEPENIYTPGSISVKGVPSN